MKFISEISSSIKEIAYFVIIISLISNLISNEKYIKHIKLFTGIILILIIINPLLKFFNSGGSLKNVFEEESMVNNINELNRSLSGIEENISSQTINDYQVCINKKVKGDLEKEGYNVERVDSVIENKENPSEEENTFEIAKIDVYLLENSDQNQISVNKVVIGENKKKVYQVSDIYIMDYIKENYNINEKIINIYR